MIYMFVMYVQGHVCLLVPFTIYMFVMYVQGHVCLLVPFTRFRFNVQHVLRH